MDILNSKRKDKVEIIDRKQIEYKQSLIGRIRPKKGHTLFEIDLKNKEIRVAQFEKEAVKYEDARFGIDSSTRKVIVNSDCVYVSCLNRKNIPKILKRDFGIEIKSRGRKTIKN